MRWTVEAKKNIRDLTNLDFDNFLQTIHNVITLQNAKEIDTTNRNNITASLKGYIIKTFIL